MSAAKRIRLEQHAMPVSSEEELTLITLREQNNKLSKNYHHRIQIEQDLRKKLERYEETLRLCEDKEPEHQLSINNEQLREENEQLEHELNKVRLNERRLMDDLDRINKEYNDLRRQATNLQGAQDSIRTSSIHSSSNDPSTLNTHHQHNNVNSNSLASSSALTSSTNSVTGTASGNGATLAATSAANSNSSSAITSANAHPTTADTLNINNQIIANQSRLLRELEEKLADQSNLAASRLEELESLNDDLREAKSVIDRLKFDAKCIPKDVIIETAEYKTLQSHFSVLYNEATQLKTQLVESRALIIDMKNSHARQIDRMEHDEIRMQKELRTNIVNLEQSLTDARSQLNMFRIQYDNVIKLNEQTVKLDTELKKSVSSYKIQVQQKNNDLNRLKRLLDEARNKCTCERNHKADGGKTISDATNNNGDNNSHHNRSNSPNHNQTKPHANDTSSSSTNNSNVTNNVSPSNKKIVELKDVIHQLQKQLDKTKSEEEALMQDLEVTGQAYEDMQEQNHRLLQQLEEKDDANFKLMSEHLKTNAFHKHLNEEKAQIEEYRDSLLKRISAQDNVVKNLEEKVHLLQENMTTLEKELVMRNDLNDSYKKETLDLRQQLAELKSEKDKITSNLEQLQRSLNERNTILSHESFKIKRLTEDLESLKRKYERANKMQSATTRDELLDEEIQAYKDVLKCPSCKTRNKDAVLTKCFHVFCFDCLKTRVDTRQRKCPKCNAQFGANDFHRLYLE